MAHSNTPYGLFVRYKNKALHRLTVPPFHDAGAGFTFCCFAENPAYWVRTAACPGLERGGAACLSPGVRTAARDCEAGLDFGCGLRACAACFCCSRTAGEGRPSELWAPAWQ